MLKISNDPSPPPFSPLQGRSIRIRDYGGGGAREGGYEGNHFATGPPVEEKRLEQPSRNNRIIWISRILVGRVGVRAKGGGEGFCCGIRGVAEHRETREAGGGEGEKRVEEVATLLSISTVLKRLRNGLLRRLYFAKIYKQLYIQLGR